MESGYLSIKRNVQEDGDGFIWHDQNFIFGVVIDLSCFQIMVLALCFSSQVQTKVADDQLSETARDILGNCLT